MWMKMVPVWKVNCCTFAVVGSAVNSNCRLRHVWKCVLGVMESPLVGSAVIFLVKIKLPGAQWVDRKYHGPVEVMRVGKTIYHFCATFLFHEENDSIVLILHRGKGRQEKKETEAEATVQHLCCSHKVILLFKRSFLSWFSFNFALFCCYSLVCSNLNT